jgi:hypothetical protein
MGLRWPFVTRRDSAARRKRQKAQEPAIGPGKAPALSWKYRVGRLLQFLGLLILPFGIASELVGKVGLGQSLLIAGGGALMFYVGYVVQHRAMEGGDPP